MDRGGQGIDILPAIVYHKRAFYSLLIGKKSEVVPVDSFSLFSTLRG